MRSDEFWEIAIAVNAAFKGLLGSMGESGHICASVVAEPVTLDLTRPWAAVLDAAIDHVADSLVDGDVVVVADKIVSASLGRIAPRALVFDPDPKTVDAARRDELAAQVADRTGLHVTGRHLLLADEYGTDQVTLGTDDPQVRAVEVSARILERTGVRCDTVISDTDTGLDVREPLIGTLTIGATPIAATAGLTIYEAMRCAVAAEFVRGHRRMMPVVVCQPAERRRARDGVGEARPYTGLLDATQEDGLAHA